MAKRSQGSNVEEGGAVWAALLFALVAVLILLKLLAIVQAGRLEDRLIRVLEML